MSLLRHTLSRLAKIGGFAPLPERQRLVVGRRLRGWAEALLLDGADAAVVSYGKSGRTWLRLMLSRFYQQRHGLPEGAFLEYDNLHRQAHEIPTLFFTHGNYLRDHTGHFDDVAEDFRGRPVVLLVRDPRDIAVSQYFQWAHRMSPHKKWLNRYPAEGEDLTIWQFVAEHEAGLDRAIAFLDAWSRAAEKLESIEIVRYEDLRAEPVATLERVLRFLDADPTPDELREAVQYAQFDNMRRLEDESRVAAAGRRLVPGERGRSDSYKVRRAKVGGWRDYFDADQIAELDARVRSGLRPGFGYSSDDFPHSGRQPSDPRRMSPAGAAGT
jgi:hypothetical protein